MEMLIPILGVLALEVIGGLLLLLVWRKRGRLGRSSKRAPVGFQLQPKLLSPAGRAFYALLTSAVGSEYCILIRVRADDVLTVTHRLNLLRYLLDLLILPGRHLDFLLCDRSTLALRCAIVLNEQGETDEFLPRACKAAGLPMVEFVVGREHAVQAVRNRILKAVGRSGEMLIEGAGISRVVRTGSTDAVLDAAATDGTDPAAAPVLDAAPRCSQCGGPMQLRPREDGELDAGSELVCTSHPPCGGGHESEEADAGLPPARG